MFILEILRWQFPGAAAYQRMNMIMYNYKVSMYTVIHNAGWQKHSELKQALSRMQGCPFCFFWLSTGS